MTGDPSITFTQAPSALIRESLRALDHVASRVRIGGDPALALRIIGTIQALLTEAQRGTIAHDKLTSAVLAYLAECDAKETTIEDVLFARDRMRRLTTEDEEEENNP
jgi:hypothetical protein